MQRREDLPDHMQGHHGALQHSVQRAVRSDCFADLAPRYWTFLMAESCVWVKTIALGTRC